MAVGFIYFSSASVCVCPEKKRNEIVSREIIVFAQSDGRRNIIIQILLLLLGGLLIGSRPEALLIPYTRAHINYRTINSDRREFPRRRPTCPLSTRDRRSQRRRRAHIESDLIYEPRDRGTPAAPR